MIAVNARSTFLCYKHAAKQMIAQGRGGRIIGAKRSHLSPWFPLAHVDVKVFRGMFNIRQNRFDSSRHTMPRSWFAHVMGAGSDLAPAYSASKFAVRGLTQAAGMPSPELSSVFQLLMKYS